MLTDPNLRAKVDQLWEKFWSGGLSNPLDAIEQFSFLLFMKRLDDEETRREAQARRRNQAYTPRLPDQVRWHTWVQYDAAKALDHVRTVVFPFLKELGTKDSSFQTYMQNAEFKINRASLLIEACKIIDDMKVSAQNQDVQGDLYEYMLGKLSTAGRNGQFRTPRHIIRMMIELVNPQPHERIGDLAAGTAGFLVNAYQYILAQHTPPESLTYDEMGEVHGADGCLLTAEQHTFLQTAALRGYDNDSGMTMLRIGSMNLMLHGLETPHFYHKDTLAKDYDEPNQYDVILMNPPFKGAIEAGEVNPHLPSNTKASELLFIHQILRVLEIGGRAAVIVPDGVLFGSSRAHQDTRQKLVEQNHLEGVISMPSGVFKPYAGVSTAILLFTKGGTTDRVWFYDMAHDGYSLDDKRTPSPDENDIPDIVEAWHKRHDAPYNQQRAADVARYRAQLEPLHAERLTLEREINRLKYEDALAPRGDTAARQALMNAQTQHDALMSQITTLKGQLDQLGRQFWVTREQVKANKFDLSASRYREVLQDGVFYEDPQVTIDRILTLENAISEGMKRIQGLLKL